jgi:septal ring factor EnvC (AmiA/AmiB activator)
LELIPLPAEGNANAPPRMMARQSLSLIGMAVELEKIRENSQCQIQELQEEIQSLQSMEEEQRHQINVLNDRLAEEQTNSMKIVEDYEAKLTQMSVEYNKVEYDLAQAKMEAREYVLFHF